MQVHVTIAHQSSFPNPISIQKGEKLSLGKRDPNWPGWVWATSNDGNQGWVPEQLLAIADDATSATSLADYNARELDTCVAERLTVEQELAGWFLVTNSAGEKGWVPKTGLKRVADV